MKNILEKFRTAHAYTRSSRLYNKGDWEGALAALDQVVATEEYRLKAALQRANILHRARRFREAYDQYSEFQTLALKATSVRKNDLDYLIAYAAFFQDEALRTFQPNQPRTVSRDHHIRLSKAASYLTKSEFVPADTL